MSADSKEMQELSARPFCTLQVASAREVCGLSGVTRVMTTRLSLVS